MAATGSSSVEGGSSQKQLAESVKRFCRSIELCDDYLRGYYGLKLVRWAENPLEVEVAAMADCISGYLPLNRRTRQSTKAG